ncbi:MAG: AI-2E family transporter [Candidatus Magasanikbacteria bacterium]
MDFSKIRNALFLTLLILVTLGLLVLFKPFFYPLFWAAVIASIFYPLYSQLKTKIKLPRLSAGIIMILVLLIIVIPVAGIGSLLVKESIDIYNSIDNNSAQIGENIQSTLAWLQNNHYIQKLGFNQQEWIQKFSDVARVVTAFIFNNLKDLTQNSVVFLVMLLLMFYALYYFLLDGAKFLRTAMHLCPLGDKYEKMLYNKFTSTALATIKSSLVVGVIQGFLGTMMFIVVGMQGAVILGVIMAALCVLPIGSGFVWGPAGIYLIITGRIWEGILVLIFGLLIISTIDNLLRPILVGKQTQMHPLLVLFSTLGGIAFFGITGFLIGPIVAALLVSLWEMYDNYYKQDLDNDK